MDFVQNDLQVVGKLRWKNREAEVFYVGKFEVGEFSFEFESSEQTWRSWTGSF